MELCFDVKKVLGLTDANDKLDVNKLIGVRGYGANSLKQLDEEIKTGAASYGVLEGVRLYGDQPYTIRILKTMVAERYSLFLPANEQYQVTGKYRAIKTLEEFMTVTDLTYDSINDKLRPMLYLRDRYDEVSTYNLLLNGYNFDDDRKPTVSLGSKTYTMEDLFMYFDIYDNKDKRYKTFGVKDFV